jgi:hypothetical protein
MNSRRFALLVLLVISILVLPLAVSAQAPTRTVTITEDEINDSFRVTNPARVRVSNVAVDLQTDQVSISYNYTVRAPRGAATSTYSVNTIYTPTITDGRLYWSVSSVTVNGQAASDDLVRQINASIETSWRNYIRRQHGTGHVTSISISETEIVITIN